MRQIFKGFSLPRPRFLQYLTVNLKVFAYCSESLRKRFRCLQNALKMPPSGLPGPLWEPMRGLWSSKLSPKILKRHLKCPKEVLSDPQKVAKGSPRNPKTSPKIPKGFLIPKWSPRVSQGCPRSAPGVPTASQRVPKGRPKGLPDAEALLTKGSVE